MHQPNSDNSVSCDVSVLTQIRASLGWTQAELAVKSGFSERLVRKVESGSAVRRSSLEVIAQALSEGTGREITTHDLVNGSMSKAKQFLAALFAEKRCVVEAVSDFLDEKILLKISGDPKIYDFAGAHTGVQEFENAFQAYFEVLAYSPSIQNHKLEVISTRNGVLAWGPISVSVRNSPVTSEVDHAIRMEFLAGNLQFLSILFDTGALRNTKQISELD